MEGGGCYCVPDGPQCDCVPEPSPCTSVSRRTTPQPPLPPSKDSRPEEQKITKRREKEKTGLLKNISQLTNFNLVFQGVIFTPVFGKPSPLKCKYRWLPLSLSLIAGLFNLSILIRLTRKYDRLTHDLAGNGKCQCGSRPVLKQKHVRERITSTFCLVMFVLFQGILLFGSGKILCYNSGSPQCCNIKNCFEQCNDAGRCILICLSTS